nr:nucleobase:cation symporter-2 family protein [Cupriavidus sp. BIC8F]
MMPPVHAVDERMPLGRLLSLAFQHVLVLYAGAVAVPLILGGALKLPPDKVAVLINADLFAGGVVTLVQCLGAWKLGARLPVMMGVSFVSVGPMIAMAANPDIGITGIYGGVIASGLFGMAISPLVTRLLPYFPPVVSGSIILLLGLSIAPIGIRWAGGGVGASDFGSPANIGIALAVLLVIVLLHKLGRGIVKNISVLLGLVFGYALCLLLGKVSFADIGSAPTFGLVLPFQFGLPTFHLAAIVSMCIVMTVILVESTGMFIAIGDIAGRPVDKRTMTRGLMADSAGAVFGGIFNTFPYTSFTQNIGLISMTGVRSRYVCAAGGVIMMVLGILPKLAHVIATIPPYVLGGAGIVMFGMVIAAGVRMLSAVDFTNNKDNLLIVAVSCCVAMIPMAAPTFFVQFPKWLTPITHSGILLGAMSAFSLNLLLNGKPRNCDATLAEHGAAIRRSES